MRVKDSLPSPKTTKILENIRQGIKAAKTEQSLGLDNSTSLILLDVVQSTMGIFVFRLRRSA